MRSVAADTVVRQAADQEQVTPLESAAFHRVAVNAHLADTCAFSPHY